MRGKAPQHIHDAVVDILTERRKQQQFSHEKLASLAGLHRTSISHIENRRRNPTLLVCLKLAHALGLSLSEILEESEKRAKR